MEQFALSMQQSVSTIGDMKEFGALIRSAREATGMYQRDLAKNMGKEPSYISRMETGQLKEIPGPEVLDMLEAELGVSRVAMLVALGFLDNDQPAEGQIPLVEVHRLSTVPRELIALLGAVDFQRGDRVATLEGILRTWIDVDRKRRQKESSDG